MSESSGKKKGFFSRIMSSLSRSNKKTDISAPPIPPVVVPPAPPAVNPSSGRSRSSTMRGTPEESKVYNVNRQWNENYSGDYNHTQKLKFDEESINLQKNCIPGPNVVFPPGSLPFSMFLSNYNKEGSLGCSSGKYPQYKDGKYCCFDNKFTQQELLDYVNNLLEAAIRNVGNTAFKKYESEIKIMMSVRSQLLQRNPSLIDNLEVPEEESRNKNGYLQKWYQVMLNDSIRLSQSPRPNPLGGRSRKNKKRNNKSKKTNKKTKRRRN